MKRFNIVKNILNKISLEDTLVVVYGNTLSKEVFEADEDNILYLNENTKPSIVIGLAMCTKKKVILFCTNEDVIFNFDSFIQIALSKMKNIACVILDSDINEDTGQEALFKRVLSVRGILFNSGFIVHDYTNYFKNKVSNEIKSAFARVIGPICVLIKTTKGVNKDLKKVDICLDENIKRFKGKLNG